MNILGTFQLRLHRFFSLYFCNAWNRRDHDVSTASTAQNAPNARESCSNPVALWQAKVYINACSGVWLHTDTSKACDLTPKRASSTGDLPRKYLACALGLRKTCILDARVGVTKTDHIRKGRRIRAFCVGQNTHYERVNRSTKLAVQTSFEVHTGEKNWALSLALSKWHVESLCSLHSMSVMLFPLYMGYCGKALPHI